MQKDLEGVLFKNDKGGNEKRPDYRGTIMIEGKTYKLSSWVNTIKQGDKAGEKFLSIKAELDNGKQSAPAPSQPETDLPF